MKLKVKVITTSIPRNTMNPSLTTERVPINNSKYYDVEDNNGILFIKGLNQPIPKHVKIGGTFKIGDIELELILDSTSS